MLKPTTAGTVAVLLSFGVKPGDTDDKLYGAAVYSRPYAMLKATITATMGWVDGKTCNIACKTSSNAAPITPYLTNAIELDWKVPVEVPADRTEATIVCDDDDSAANHLTIFASSVSSNKWGASGSCWYSGYTTSSKSHAMLCNNLGKVAKDT